jgi:molybdate transport system substrate-binding protein
MRQKPLPLIAIFAVLAFGCSQAAKEPQELLVFAASSLTDAFTDIGTGFEAAEAGVDVTLNFAGSSALREQIVEGAPAGVFASASGSIMDQVVEAGLVARDPRVFAINRLQIVVPAGNPGSVTELSDLSNPHLLVGLCAEGVPCGDFALEALALAGVEASVDSLEPDVRALLTKVQSGELDAGIVYVTDVLAAGDQVEGIVIPDEFNVQASYPIAVLVAAPNPDSALAFVEFVLSDAGRAVLQGYGFGPP